MTVREYLGILRQSWRTILVAVCLGAAAAVALTWVLPPRYSASVTFYITTTSAGATPFDAYQGSLMSEDRVKSYQQLLSSYRTGLGVVNDLKLAADPADVSREISTSVTPNTLLLTVTVTDSSAHRAQAIAGSLTRVFPTLVATLEKPLVGDSPPAVIARVVQGPLLATRVSPLLSRYLPIGCVAGLLIGVVVAVLRRRLDPRVRTVEELRAAFPKPVLGTLVKDRAVRKAPLFLRDRPQEAISENLRLIRTNFEIWTRGRGAGCYLVTSAVHQEGKSLVVANLALAQSAAGRQVLVIEGDLRTPRAAAYLGMQEQPGMSEVLSGQVTLADAVQQGPSSRLLCLSSGWLPPDPYELLTSRQMGILLEQAREQYDVVLIDAPPLLAVADALELARRSDGVLFVVRTRRAPAPSITRAHDLLEAAGIDRVCTVLNAVPPAEAGAYSNGYRAQIRDGGGKGKHAEHDRTPRTLFEQPTLPSAPVPESDPGHPGTVDAATSPTELEHR